MKNNGVIIVVIIVLVGAAAFFGGMQYQKSQANINAPSMAGAQPGQGGQRLGRFTTGANRPIVGEVVSEDANSITIKAQDGSSKIINIVTTTKISKSSTAAVSDFQNSQRVAVVGTPNADGSVTAQSVQINPQTRQGTQGQGEQAPSPAQGGTSY